MKTPPSRMISPRVGFLSFSLFDSLLIVFFNSWLNIVNVPLFLPSSPNKLSLLEFIRDELILFLAKKFSSIFWSLLGELKLRLKLLFLNKPLNKLLELFCWLLFSLVLFWNSFWLNKDEPSTCIFSSLLNKLFWK